MTVAALERIGEVERVDTLSKRVNQNAGLIEARSKAHALLDNFENQKFATRKTVQEYRKSLDADKTQEGVQGFYDWMQKGWDKANLKLQEIQAKIDEGIRDKAMTEDNREFLMKRLILTDEYDFVGKDNLQKIAKLVEEKVDRMRDDRKEYDKLAQHKLIKNTGFIKTSPTKKLNFPGEKEFLEMDPPERRKRIEELKKALPEAEKYAKIEGGVESEKEIVKYEQLLEAARKKGLLGKVSIKKFMDGFKKIDLAEKKEWVKEMENENQLKPYKILWEDIRKTLGKEEVAKLESMRDRLGRSDLEYQFQLAKGRESVKLNKKYGYQLMQMAQAKVISKHTYLAFKKDMRAQSLEGKRHYDKEFNNQMTPYVKLRLRIDKMKDKEAKSVIDEMYKNETDGYTEIKARYERFTGNIVAANDSNEKIESEAQKKLNQITNTTVKRAAIWAKNELSNTETKSFLRKIDHFFSGRLASRIDASSYQKSIRRAKSSQFEEESPVVEKGAQEEIREKSKVMQSTEMLEQVDQDHNEDLEPPVDNVVSIESRSEPKKKSGSSKVSIKTNSDQAFQQNTYETKDEKYRVTRVGIGSKEAIQAFNAESLHGKKDHLSLMAKEGSHIVELKMQQIRSFRDFLHASVANDESGLDKAA